MSLSTGLKFKTKVSISALEDWLEANCTGEWDLDLEAISSTLDGQKKVAVFFELDTDRDAFKLAAKNLN